MHTALHTASKQKKNAFQIHSPALEIINSYINEVMRIYKYAFYQNHV